MPKCNSVSRTATAFCSNHETMNDKGKVRVTGVSGLPKGMDVPKQVNESIYFSLDDFSRSLYESLPKYFKETIAKSPEYKNIVGSLGDLQSDTPEQIEKDSDIPFRSVEHGHLKNMTSTTNALREGVWG